jgi:hypothetical protein
MGLGASGFATQADREGAHKAARDLESVVDLLQVRQALRDYRAGLVTFLEATEDGLVVANPYGNITHCSVHLKDVWNLPELPAKGTKLSEFAIQLDSLVASPGFFTRQLLENQTENRGRIGLKDGRTLEFHSTCYGSEHANGTIWRFADISANLRLQEQLWQSQKLEAIGRLAGGIAHDFNNILFTITSVCDLIQLRASGHLPFAKEIGEIQDSADRASTLIRKLQAFSRQQAQHTDVLNINELIVGLERIIPRLIGEHVDVRLTLCTTLAPVLADPGHIEQILLNLSANARDAMPTGGTLRIETANVQIDESNTLLHDAIPGPYVRLSFSDNGIGMTDVVRSHMFEPFFTTKPSGKGTGLGLASVYGIVQQHGGHILVRSEENKGTTVDIYFPQTEQKRAAPPAQREAPPAQGKGEVILLAEDQPLPRELTCHALATHGYQVLVASDGQEALQIASNPERSIHLLLSDILMPKLNGPDLYRTLKVKRPNLRAIFMSGYNGPASNAEKLGDAFIEKPFAISALLRRVRQVLDK